METISKEFVQKTIVARQSDSFKGTYGHVILVGGNAQFGGAIIMASMASVYSGAGLVTTASDPVNRASLHSLLPEAMITDFSDFTTLQPLVQKSDVITIGPGLGTDNDSLSTLKHVFDWVQPEQTLIIDGSAITMIAQHQLKLPNAKLVFTPHQMEWQRLSGIPLNQQSNHELNQKVQQQLGGIVVLKSNHTHVYTNNHIFVNPCGTPAQATGGMGDTLAGMISGFAAQFQDLEAAVVSAVYAHSDIADKLAQQQYVVLPHQIIHHIPQYMHQHQSK